MQKYFIFAIIAIFIICVFSIKAKETKVEYKPKTEQMVIFKSESEEVMTFAPRKKGRRVY